MSKTTLTRVFLISLSLLIAIGLLFRDFIFLDLPDLMILLYAFLGFLFSSFLGIMLHEVGHLIFGLTQGMQAKRIFFGFFMIDFEEKVAGLYFSPEFGFCTMVPTSADKMEKKFGIHLVGGLIFSFLYLIFTIFCVFRMDSLHFIFAYGLPICFYLFFFNMIPLSTGNTETDGKLLLSLFKKEGEAMYAIRALAIEADLRKHSPSEQDEAFYADLPIIADDKRMFMLMTWYRYLRSLDQGDNKKIIEYDHRLRDVLEYQTDEDLEELYSAILYDCCTVEENEEGARGLFERQETYLLSRKDSTGFRILAAYHQKYGDQKLYELYHETAIALLDRENYEGIRKMEEKLLYKRNV